MTAGKLLFAVALLVSTAPAPARPTPTPAPAPTSIPEPGDTGLFLLGAAGIAVGRWMHARRASKQKRDEAGE